MASSTSSNLSSPPLSPIEPPVPMVPFIPSLPRTAVQAVPIPKRKPLPGVNKPRVSPPSQLPAHVRDILYQELGLQISRSPDESIETYQDRLRITNQLIKITDIIERGNLRLYMVRYSMSYLNEEGIKVKLSIPHYPTLRGVVVVVPNIEQPSQGFVYNVCFPFTPTCFSSNGLESFFQDNQLVFPPVIEGESPVIFPIDPTYVPQTTSVNYNNTNVHYQIPGAVLLILSRIGGECYFRTSRRIDGGSLSWGNDKTFEQLYYEGGGLPLDMIFDFSKDYDKISHCFLVFGPNMLIGSYNVTRATTIFVNSFFTDDQEMNRLLEPDDVATGRDIAYLYNSIYGEPLLAVSYLPDNFEDIYPPGKMLSLKQLSYHQASELITQSQPPVKSKVNQIPVMSNPFVARPCGLHLTYYPEEFVHMATMKVSNQTLLRTNALSFNQPTLYDSLTRSIQVNRVMIHSKWETFLLNKRGELRSPSYLRSEVEKFSTETTHDVTNPAYPVLLLLDTFNRNYIVPVIDNPTLSRIIPSDQELLALAHSNSRISSQYYYQYGLLEPIISLYRDVNSRANFKTLLALYISQLCYYNLLETLSYSRLMEALGESTGQSLLRKVDDRVNQATNILLRMYQDHLSFGGNDKLSQIGNENYGYLKRRVESRYRKYNESFPPVSSGSKKKKPDHDDFNLKLSYFRLEAIPVLITNPRFVDAVLLRH